MKVFHILPPTNTKMEMPFSNWDLASEAYLRSKGKDVDIYRGKFFDSAVFAHQVQRSKPDILYMTCIWTNMHYCFVLAELVKKIDSHIYIVVGGSPVTAIHKVILERVPWVDAVIRGEVEETLIETIDCLEERKRHAHLANVRGLSYRSSGKILVNENRPFIKDLDSLPLPPKNMLKRYERSMGVFFPETGRGCPNSCSFCDVVDAWKRRVRKKSIDRTIEEIIYFKKHAKARKFFFRDPIFTVNRSKVVAFCQSLIRNNVNIKWEVDTNLNCVDRDLLMIMKEAGCTGIVYGVESLSDRVLELTGKGFSSKLAVDVLKMTRQLGLRTDYCIVLGLPGETEKTLAETFCRIKKLGIYCHPSGVDLFQLFPGSRIYKKMEQQGLISDEMWFNDPQGMDLFRKRFYSAEFQMTLAFYQQEICRLYRLERS
ncbi:MAG: B12-binding domain-containing radical SAM protein [Candidatus Omnitrophica bacterium]|nr:B12-binding domain-containing radical SAM protein [Candidatus Omnitrophota bacterium]